MDLATVITEAIQLADEHAPRGEVLPNFHNRRAAYVLKALQDAGVKFPASAKPVRADA